MISGTKIMAKRDKYENPLVSRYASKEMSYIWSPEKKFTTWRSLWVYLAEGEKELGLDITEEQIAELKKFQNNVNYDVAERKEKKLGMMLCRMYMHMGYNALVQKVLYI